MENTRTAARQVMYDAEKLIRSNDYVGLNEFLKNFHYANYPCGCSTALIRSTFRVRDKLESWESTYYKIWNHVQDKQGNVKELFIGMQKPVGTSNV